MQLEKYPFLRLDDWRAEARARRIDVIDFGIGDPREVTPLFIREALKDAIEERSSYPRAVGLPELREAIAAWIAQRYGVAVDPLVEIIPTLGAKEAIFSFAQVALGERRLVAIPELAYPVYERGALAAGGSVATVPLREETGWLPDLDAIDFWDELALFWICYPNNPTGATAPLSFYEELAGLAREHDFLICSDEAYSELWFDEPPASALQASRDHTVVFNTLSKRSSMTGYRSGFMCAPPAVADALRAFRPSAGTAPQEFVQRASVAAWSDEEHVVAVREVYRAKRDTLLPLFERKGIRSAGGNASFFLWLAVGGPSEAFARNLLEHGILVMPGSFFGAAGEGYIRVALVPTQADCERAAEILERVL